MSRATATGIRLAPPTLRLVGSKGEACPPATHRAHGPDAAALVATSSPLANEAPIGSFRQPTMDRHRPIVAGDVTAGTESQHLRRRPDAVRGWVSSGSLVQSNDLAPAHSSGGLLFGGIATLVRADKRYSGRRNSPILKSQACAGTADVSEFTPSPLGRCPGPLPPADPSVRIIALVAQAERTHAGRVISRCLGQSGIGGDAVRPTPPYRRATA